MFIGVQKLIESDRISYSFLSQMIEAGLIKKIFIKNGQGYFTAITEIRELEERYKKSAEQQLDLEQGCVKSSKELFIRVCKRYKENYSDFKRRYKWEENRLGICRDKIKEIMKLDKQNYNQHRYYLREARQRYKDKKDRLEAEKNERIYASVFLLETEYNQAKEIYAKSLLKNDEEN